MLLPTDGVKLQAKNCEDSRECRLLNKKKTSEKSDYRERSYAGLYTPSETEYTYI